MSFEKGLIPGSFDPPTKGHLEIIKQASSMCGKLYVLIAVNPEKEYMFSAPERKEMLEQLLADYKNTEVCIWNGFTVDFAKDKKVFNFFRGIRNSKDYDYENKLAKAYKTMCQEIEITYIQAPGIYKGISSTSVKQAAFEGKDVSDLVPEIVNSRILRKVKRLT